MKKRVFSLMLALVLVLSLTPMALAYDGRTPQTASRISVTENQPAGPAEFFPSLTGWEEQIPYEAPEPALEEEYLSGAAIDENEIYQILNSLRGQYPEGMRWTNEDNVYTLQVPVYDEKSGITYTMIGGGCVAFCYELSDIAFGSLSARRVYSFTYDDIHVGDILRFNDNTSREHSVIVLQKFSDHVVIAEGNYNSSVHWDRTISRDEVMGANYIITRYPSGSSSSQPSGQQPSGTSSAPANVTVSTDKASYMVGETVTISYSADNAVSYNISIWRGAYGAGTKVAAKDGITASKATYQTENAGTYTLYVEAVNDYGTSSATCQFSVTNGGPSNLKLTADRSVFAVDEPFYITVTADDMTGYNAELWLGEYGTGTLIGSLENVSPNERIEVTLGTRDSYTIYVEAYNDYGKTTATMTVSAADSLTFTDVPQGAYYADAVDWAVSLGVTEGTGNNKFSPNFTVTRGEAVTFLWRAMNRPTPTSSYHTFTDVDPSAYYYQAMLWAVENGITDGVSATRFNPGGSVSRGEMVTFLWRTQGRPGETGQGEWYSDAEYWARANSLLSGTAVSYTTAGVCPRSDVVYYLWNALT